MSVTVQRNASRPWVPIVWYTHRLGEVQTEEIRAVVVEDWVRRYGRRPESIEFLWVAEQYGD